MKRDGYEVVTYEPEFRKQVLELQRHLWSPSVDVNSAYLKWKYEENPYLDTPLIYVSLWKGEVVGMRGFYGAKWEAGEPRQTSIVLCAGDLVVAPEHRNQGLFAGMMEVALKDLAARGYVYAFNLSAATITKVQSLMTGWRTAGLLRPMSFNADQKIASGDKDSFFFRLDDPSGRGYKPRRDVRVERGPRPEAMARLVARIEYDGRLRHVRDTQYFAWRFQNPLCGYRFLYCGDAELEGYLVLGKPPFTGVSIVDWEANDLCARDELLRAAMEWGKFDRLTIWSATLSTEVRELLKKRGFEPVLESGRVIEGSPVILLRDVREAMVKADWDFQNRRLTDMANWDVRMIYSDGY
jgi:GNAT superfamily N-acetyltransferase